MVLEGFEKGNLGRTIFRRCCRRPYRYLFSINSGPYYLSVYSRVGYDDNMIWFCLSLCFGALQIDTHYFLFEYCGQRSLSPPTRPSYCRIHDFDTNRSCIATAVQYDTMRYVQHASSPQMEGDKKIEVNQVLDMPLDMPLDLVVKR